VQVKCCGWNKVRTPGLFAGCQPAPDQVLSDLLSSRTTSWPHCIMSSQLATMTHQQATSYQRELGNTHHLVDDCATGCPPLGLCDKCR
jgi:hypothetical protein